MKRQEGIQKTEALLDLLKGFKEAGEFVRAERKEGLKVLTTKESLEIYNDLCNFWESQNNSYEAKGMARHRIEFLLRRRRLLNSVGIGIKK